jgi:hypothetical protein
MNITVVATSLLLIMYITSIMRMRAAGNIFQCLQICPRGMHFTIPLTIAIISFLVAKLLSLSASPHERIKPYAK